jgi:predicted GNAT superfamily acetyltransferase
MRARNAHFNLNRLGVIVEDYAENFYGTDYGIDPSDTVAQSRGIDSDRLFASWYLRSARVTDRAGGRSSEIPGAPATAIAIPPNWAQLVKEDPQAARQEQLRVRREFQHALAAGLICAAFDRDPGRPSYLFYERDRI